MYIANLLQSASLLKRAIVDTDLSRSYRRDNSSVSVWNVRLEIAIADMYDKRRGVEELLSYGDFSDEGNHRSICFNGGLVAMENTRENRPAHAAQHR